jgi:hypothetical protein
MPTDKERIENGEWVECRICLETFLRQRMTKRYCDTCGANTETLGGEGLASVFAAQSALVNDGI